MRVSRQARVRLVTVDDQQQAPRLVFHLPYLRQGEEFCRVQTRPPTDVRRTRFDGHRVELIIYGPIFWKVGEVTTLQLEPYKARRPGVSGEERTRPRKRRALIGFRHHALVPAAKP